MTLTARSIGILALVALAAGSPAASAQPARVGVVASVRGEAMLSRASLPEPTPLQRRDDVFVADRITTGEQSFTRLLLGGKALVTVRERSTLTIMEAPGTSVVDVATGAVAVAVAKERMRPGETVEIRTPNAVAGIRGTVVIAEVGGADDRTTTTITVLRGLVAVRPLDGATRHPLGPGVHVGAAQMIRITSLPAPTRPIPTPVQPLTPEVRQRLGVEWKGALSDMPAGTPPSVVETQKQEAAALVERVLERRREEERKSGATPASAGHDTRILSGAQPSGGGSGSSPSSGSSLSGTALGGSSGVGGSSGPSLSTSTLSGGSSGSSLTPTTLSGGSSGPSLSTPTLTSGSSGSSLTSGPSLPSPGSGGTGGSSGSSSLTSGTSGSNSGSGLGLIRILSPLLPGK
jgi:uncharacterized membrane protein YgcG